MQRNKTLKYLTKAIRNEVYPLDFDWVANPKLTLHQNMYYLLPATTLRLSQII